MDDDTNTLEGGETGFAWVHHAGVEEIARSPQGKSLDFGSTHGRLLTAQRSKNCHMMSNAPKPMSLKAH